MNRRIASFFILLAVGAAVIVGLRFLRPLIFDRQQKSTSDASQTKQAIVIGVDNWIGYAPLCGKEMRKRMHGAGYLIKCVDDKGDYAGRMKRLQTHQLDLAVATIDSFLLNAAGVGFPATIVTVIDESKGGDALIARRDSLASLDGLKKRNDYKIAFTPASPSDHLLKSIATHFDVPNLKHRNNGWRVEVSGSTEALKKLESKEVDAAVLWEPDVSKALAKPEFVKLLGTENTEKLIVDILLANREYSQQNPQVVKVLLGNYFRALKAYRDNPQLLSEEVQAATRLSNAQVETMLHGVKWINLAENARQWFGVTSPGSGRSAHEGLIDAIEATVPILIESGDFSRNPIPEGDPYRLQHRLFVEELFLNGVPGQFAEGGAIPDKEAHSDSGHTFKPLTANQWAQLSEVGTLKVRPITFQSGTSELNESGRAEVEKALENLSHYPNFRVLIKGHTGLKGEPEANRRLSQERAEAVKRLLISELHLDPHRLRAVGLGQDKPLPLLEGESERAYNYRLPRVELVLVSDEI